VIWRRVLEEVGGYCHCVIEDLDLTLRLRSRGYRLGLMNSKVLSEVPSSYQTMKNQLARWQFSGIWCLRRHIRDILGSGMGPWEKIDSVLWMIQFPSLSITALSTMISTVLVLLGVVLPPIQVMALNMAFTLLALAQFAIILIVGKRLGYGLWSSADNAVKSAVLALLLSFPMLIYAMEAITRDEWPWTPTPKGSRSRLGEVNLNHEVAAISVFATILAASMAMGNIAAVVYIIGIISVMIYGIRIIRR
jgi:cellulose synthase/poly-beta-1,6-N-acetylglucosamine synthase-like glycosyltransferase